MSLFDMNDYRDTGEIDMSEHEDNFVELTNDEEKKQPFKDRQIEYMTSAVIWFLLICLAVLVGSGVWKLIA